MLLRHGPSQGLDTLGALFMSVLPVAQGKQRDFYVSLGCKEQNNFYCKQLPGSPLLALNVVHLHRPGG
jgi:hypothetical protein